MRRVKLFNADDAWYVWNIELHWVHMNQPIHALGLVEWELER